MAKLLRLTLMLLLSPWLITAQQLADSCKLQFGTNISGLSDWGSEQPFVNLMKASREWYSKDVGDPNAPFNSEAADSISYLANGYPTHAPQTIPGRPYPQTVATVWGLTDGWEAGTYVVLFDGNGKLSFWGGCSNVTLTAPNRYTFDLVAPIGNLIELKIDSSDINQPVQNIRIIKDSYESTYQTQPFNPIWLQKVLMFGSVRFMDWGHTNNWGQPDDWTWQDSTRWGWNARSKMDDYTWTTKRGVPYEMMIRLMNDYDIDGWVCVPHKANNDYIQQMAQLFHNQLETERKLTIEYSNEIWNWMFGQAQWLNKYGCVDMGVPWPEGTVPYIQNCMNIWTSVFGNNSSRLTRAVGVQTGWLDVSQRMTFNMSPGSFDMVAATYYFGLTDSADAILDNLGGNATAQDVASLVRATWHEGKGMMEGIKANIADTLGLKLGFYEGGQHITPNPFGTMPTYSNALLEIQRDTAIYNLYKEWLTFVRTLQEGPEPLRCMNFSLVSNRSAQYGSWGIWETMYQDTATIPAPKLRAMIEEIHPGCWPTAVGILDKKLVSTLILFPNPVHENLMVEISENTTAVISNILGKTVMRLHLKSGTNQISCSQLTEGLYFIKTDNGRVAKFLKR